MLWGDTAAWLAGTLAAAVAGMVLLAWGGAIVVPHVGTPGSGGHVAWGLVLVALGAGGLVVAGRRCLAAIHGRRRRALLVLPLLLLAYVVAYPVAAAVATTDVPRATLGDRTPADLGLAYEDVTFPARDGTQLAGWYLPSRNGAAVAVLHGASSARTAVLDQAAVLARHGYGVLLYDARGMGASEGRAMNIGWSGEDDLAGAVDLLAARPDVDADRIGAVGESMGGEVAIGALAADPRLRAVVAEGATVRVESDLHWLDDRYGVRGWVQQQVESLRFALTDLLATPDPPRSLHDAVTAAAPRPVLLVVASTVADEANAANDMQAASPSSVSTWVVPGASHIGGLRAAPAEWEQRVTSFLDAQLRTTR